MKLSTIKIFLTIFVVIISLCWSRFYSWGFISPWWKSEINIPLAPLFAAFTLFLWLIFDESDFKNKTREKLDKILRQKSVKILSLFIFVTGASLLLTNIMVPPKWAELIDNALLSGYDDEFSRAFNIQGEVESINKEFSLLLKTTIELESKNKESSNWVDSENFKRLNQLQKILETITPISGYSRNLKDYSNALLNDMYLRLDYFKNNKVVVSKEIESSLNSILNSRNIYKTDKFEDICQRMLANTYYKMGKVAEAIKNWEKLDVSPNVYANIHVGYRDLNEFDNAMKASDAGFKLIDEGFEEDSQSKEALVANTMTTLMHMQKLSDAVDLYRYHYITKGKTSDSALLQTYGFLLVLTDDTFAAEKLIADGNIASDDAEYVHLLISLQKQQKNEALRIARDILGVGKSKMDSEKVWELISNEFESAGYLGSDKLKSLFIWASNNAI